jgi:transcriptional regulator with XRE-family HTH domain
MVNMNASAFPESPLYDAAEMPPKTDQLLADIKAWCEANGVKRIQLARMLGVNRSAISDWYNPKSGKNPTAEQALTMVELLKTKPGGTLKD